MIKHVSKVTTQFAVFAVFFVAWELSVDLLHVRPVILPAPSDIFVSIWQHRAYLMEQTWPTFFAVGAGFLFAAVFGVLIAVGIAYSKWVSEMIYPFLVAAQVLPKIALAPLFLIWFGFGVTPKVVIAALIAFFPIVVNTARGLASVDVELTQYMKSLGASRSEVFIKISLPWALPYIFASFKIAMTLAVVGAVVGEFVASDRGLGYVISYANISLDTELMFAGIFVLSALGLLFFLAVVIAERALAPWQAVIEGTPETA
jgi:NitT/TauT family transport system permease protein